MPQLLTEGGEAKVSKAFCDLFLVILDRLLSQGDYVNVFDHFLIGKNKCITSPEGFFKLNKSVEEGKENA